MMSNTILKTSIPAFDAKDQTEGQMPHIRWPLRQSVMPKTKPMYKYHTKENLSTCLWYQRSYSKANARTKITFQPVCDVKDHNKEQMPDPRTPLIPFVMPNPYWRTNAISKNISNWRWCQRPFSITKAKTKNTSQYACDAKDHTQVQMTYLRRPQLACDAKKHSQLQKPNPRTPLNLPEMSKTKLKYKCQTQKYLLTCLWCQIPHSRHLYLRWMSKTKLKRKCHSQYDFYTCLRCQRPYWSTKYHIEENSQPPWCQRSNWCTNTIAKNTCQSVCDAKNRSQVQMLDP